MTYELGGIIAAGIAFLGMLAAVWTHLKGYVDSALKQHLELPYHKGAARQEQFQDLKAEVTRLSQTAVSKDVFEQNRRERMEQISELFKLTRETRDVVIRIEENLKAQNKAKQ